MKPCGVEVAYKVDGKLEVALISLDLYSKLIDHIANLHGELISVKVIYLRRSIKMKRHIIVETTDLKHCLIAANFFRNCNTALYLIRQRGVWQLSARY